MQQRATAAANAGLLESALGVLGFSVALPAMGEAVHSLDATFVGLG